MSPSSLLVSLAGTIVHGRQGGEERVVVNALDDVDRLEPNSLNSGVCGELKYYVRSHTTTKGGILRVVTYFYIGALRQRAVSKP